LRARPDGLPGFALPEGGVDAGEARPDDIALVLHTSGTTARPKEVPLRQRNLCASARNVAATLRLSEADRALNIHGLVAGLRASISVGASVVGAPGFDPRRVREWIARLRPTWYSAVPTIHMAMRDVFEDAPPQGGFPFRFVRSSSSALPPPVMTALEALYGVPVIEAYGMTEAAHQIASNPLPPAMRKPGSVGLPAGPEIAVRDGEGRDAAEGVEGEVWIRGDTVSPGYHDNDAANAESYANGWFRTGDLGRFDADGYLFLTGRLKELVNRGGEKIAPAEIDNALLEHPGVAQAVCCAMPHPTLGEEVAAVVVLRPDAGDVTPRDLLAHCASRLAPCKRPRQILIVPELPKGATGKVQRRGLWEALARLRA
jgi:acyl-CoA synthetase (AMP-forming)/AMP-acid ligase II